MKRLLNSLRCRQVAPFSSSVTYCEGIQDEKPRLDVQQQQQQSSNLTDSNVGRPFDPEVGKLNNPYTFRRRRLSNVRRPDLSDGAGRKQQTISQMHKQENLIAHKLARRHSYARNINTELSPKQMEDLPLPPRVLGIFTCPGLEPVYHVDYVRHVDGFEREEITKVATIAKINQDRGVAAYPYGLDENRKVALFGVYDGHGAMGGQIAQHVMAAIQRDLVLHPTFESDLARAFLGVFRHVDEMIQNLSYVDANYSGTTACVVLLTEKDITTSNVGDSRCVLGRRSKEGKILAIELTKDQNPDCESEYNRIVESGGFVSPPEGDGLSARVWLDQDYTQVGLAMARSIGDHILRQVGVICDPVVNTVPLEAEVDEFLILGSDGIWEFISSEEAVEIVHACLRSGDGASFACKTLIDIAASRWRYVEGDYRDDITAIVVDLKSIWNQ
uniref:PPM-type phosphatase domain-containing protein n=1 Tax=Leptocylindrus danicus TaxID=163516 RepID=A0A7S2NWU3_9STRA|mmetsp:Transcript_16143/g.23773  ORF Transcript_16143/g.23773 Transcript_16143/m.23773 type:complete len:444 (+) Transcript_16143:156-1487(+)